MKKQMTAFIRFINSALEATENKKACIYINVSRLQKGNRQSVEVKCTDAAYDKIIALGAAPKQRFDTKATFTGHWWKNKKGEFCFSATDVEIFAETAKSEQAA